MAFPAPAQSNRQNTVEMSSQAPKACLATPTCPAPGLSQSSGWATQAASKDWLGHAKTPNVITNGFAPLI